MYAVNCEGEAQNIQGKTAQLKLGAPGTQPWRDVLKSQV